MKVENTRKLQIGKIVPYLDTGHIYEASWSNNGVIESSLEYYLEPLGDNYYLMNVEYEVQGEDISYQIPIVPQSCHFGGYRYWFTCLNCSKRAYFLHYSSLNKYFLCRECQDLRYDLQAINYGTSRASLIRLMRTIDKYEQISHGYTLYAGKPTKRALKRYRYKAKLLEHLGYDVV